MERRTESHGKWTREKPSQTPQKGRSVANYFWFLKGTAIVVSPRMRERKGTESRISPRQGGGKKK